MENDGVFRVALLLLFTLFIGHRGYYTRKYGDSPRGQNQDSAPPPSSGLANGIAVLAAIALLLYLLVPSWLAWAAIPFPLEVRWGGVGLTAIGFGLLQWSHNALGNNWSDTPRLIRGQSLVTTGPYRWVRHPIYASFLLILAAPLFISANWVVGVPWIIMTVLETISRVRFEESLMLTQFPGEYRAYMQRTGRLMPRIRRNDVDAP